MDETEMLKGFDEFRPSTARAGRKPTATLQKRGLIGLNAAAYDAMGEPEAVEFLYNTQARVIALRPVDPAVVSHASTVRGSGANSATRLISATALVAYYEIDVTDSIRRDIEVRDHIAFVDLKEPGIVVRGNRGPRKQATSQGDGLDEGEHTPE
ncbi:MAG: hypothetical protein ACR2P2_14580 [Nakamurella sp.]